MAATKLATPQTLKELRLSLGLTQTDLARKMRVRQPVISRMEERREAMQLSSLRRYIKALGGETVVLARFPDGTTWEIY